MWKSEQQSAAEGARSLGWGSIGIGLLELVAPHQVERMLGLDHSRKTHGILRALGVRELLHGVGILTESRASPQLAAGAWARVLGDALDSALLGVAATKTKRPASFAAVAATVTAIGAADLYYAMKVQQQQNGFFSRYI
ncbi:MAG TPA: hypothetical protein VF175_05860 [Lacipirellula sp.]